MTAKIYAQNISRKKKKSGNNIYKKEIKRFILFDSVITSFGQVPTNEINSLWSGVSLNRLNRSNPADQRKNTRAYSSIFS